MSCQLLGGKYLAVTAGDVLVKADRVLVKWYAGHILSKCHFIALGFKL